MTVSPPLSLSPSLVTKYSLNVSIAFFQSVTHQSSKSSRSCASEGGRDLGQ